jgi:ketosteroid isomerase-like protein
MRADMNDPLSPTLRALALVTTLAVAGCYPREAILTNADRAAIATAVEATWAGMMTGGRALDPDRIRAGYADRPIVAINGRIIEDFDRDQFDETRQWLRSLQRFNASYDHVHLEVLSPATAVATMNHHLTWTDSTGTSGEWNSAWTAVFRLIKGRWKIAYAHESTPRPEEQ